MTTTCSWTAPGTFPPIYCQLPVDHLGWHYGTDGSEWITSEDVRREERQA